MEAEYIQRIKRENKERKKKKVCMFTDLGLKLVRDIIILDKTKK